jgi:hypothetical protein
MMGLELRVRAASTGTLAWPAFRELLASQGCAVEIRMIDGELAFQDESPATTWQELRVGTASAW